MKTILSLALVALVSACSTAQPLAQTPSYTIHNPDIYATQQPLVDDNGVPLALPTTVGKGPAELAQGKGRMAD